MNVAELEKKTDSTVSIHQVRSALAKLTKSKITPEKPVRPDKPLSEKQIKISKWFAAHRRLQFPPELLNSNKKWWAWLNSNITPIDREDAHAASIDFSKLRNLDLNDPLQIIGALKYAAEADGSDRLEDAKHQLLAGEHIHTVQDVFLLTQAELDALVKEIEFSHSELEFDGEQFKRFYLDQ